MAASRSTTSQPSFVCIQQCHCFLRRRPHTDANCNTRLKFAPSNYAPKRRRLRSTASPPDPANADSDQPHDDQPTANDSEQAKPEQPTNGETVESSDLALPNLRELFQGAGKPGCEQCAGDGEVPCPVCEAKGFISLTMMDVTSSVQCRLCRGQRAIPCPTCRQMVYKSVLWWDKIPSKDDDPNEDWRQGPDGPRVSWGDPPATP